MKIRAMANGVIQAVNPDIEAIIYKEDGGEYIKGVWVPKYEKLTVKVQKQQLTQKDILFMQNMELQGSVISLYVRGHYNGINRISVKSADIFIIDGQEWKVLYVPEQWSTWTRAVVCEQKKSIMD